MRTPSVSVILCTYNHGRFIERSIQSVLSQTFENLELIVVNDGSTDSTDELVRAACEKDPRVVYLSNERNIGVPRSLNKALMRARGKYIARVDSDDAWIGADKLEKQVRFLEDHSDCVATGGGMISVDAAGNELFRYLKPENDRDIRKSALITNPIANSTSLCRKDAILRAGLCNETLEYNEDWDFWLKIGCVGKLYNFPEYFSYYTMTGSNKSMVFLAPHTRSGLRIIFRYRKNYPNFLKGLVINCTQLLFGLVPFRIRRGLHPLLSRGKKTLAGSRRSRRND